VGGRPEELGGCKWGVDDAFMGKAQAHDE